MCVYGSTTFSKGITRILLYTHTCTHVYARLLISVYIYTNIYVYMETYTYIFI